jgi:hypothetical protein
LYQPSQHPNTKRPKRENKIKRGCNSLGQISNGLPHHLEAVVQHQDVNGAHEPQRPLDHVIARLVAPQVGREEVHLAVLLLHQALRILGVLLLLGRVHDGALGALHGKQDGDSAADAAVAARDERLGARTACRLRGRSGSRRWGWAAGRLRAVCLASGAAGRGCGLGARWALCGL